MDKLFGFVLGIVITLPFIKYYFFIENLFNEVKTCKLKFKNWKSYYEINPNIWLYKKRTYDLVKKLYYKKNDRCYVQIKFSFIDYLKFIQYKKLEAKNKNKIKEIHEEICILKNVQQDIDKANNLTYSYKEKAKKEMEKYL